MLFFYNVMCLASQQDYLDSTSIQLTVALHKIIFPVTQNKEYYDDSLELSVINQHKIARSIEQHFSNRVRKNCLTSDDYCNAIQEDCCSFFKKYACAYRFDERSKKNIAEILSDVDREKNSSNSSSPKSLQSDSYYHQGSFESNYSMQGYSTQTSPEIIRKKTVSFDKA